jgi:hypothetical protein
VARVPCGNELWPKDGRFIVSRGGGRCKLEQLAAEGLIHEQLAAEGLIHEQLAAEGLIHGQLAAEGLIQWLRSHTAVGQESIQ